MQDPVGFWDPVGFTSDGDVATFKRRRSVELKLGSRRTDPQLGYMMYVSRIGEYGAYPRKHGRISMMATMGAWSKDVIRRCSLLQCAVTNER